MLHLWVYLRSQLPSHLYSSLVFSCSVMLIIKEILSSHCICCPKPSPSRRSHIFLSNPWGRFVPPSLSLTSSFLRYRSVQAFLDPESTLTSTVAGVHRMHMKPTPLHAAQGRAPVQNGQSVQTDPLEYLCNT